MFLIARMDFPLLFKPQYRQDHNKSRAAKAIENLWTPCIASSRQKPMPPERSPSSTLKPLRGAPAS